MGTLKPGSSYTYENVGNTTYATAQGHENEKIVVGYSVDKDAQDSVKYFADKYHLEVEWAKILKAAETNFQLRDAIDHVKILYYLSEQDAK